MKENQKWHYCHNISDGVYTINSYPNHPQDRGLEVFNEKHVGKDVAMYNATIASMAPELIEALIECKKSLQLNLYKALFKDEQSMYSAYIKAEQLLKSIENDTKI